MGEQWGNLKRSFIRWYLEDESCANVRECLYSSEMSTEVLRDMVSWCL